MAKTPKAGAGARSFAHLLGLPSRGMAKGKVEGEEPKKDDDKKDDKEAAKAEQQPDTDDDGKAQCAVCEGTGTDEDGDKCEACDGTGEVGASEEPEPRREGAKAETDDEDDVGEAKGRKAANLRWARVMSHPGTTGSKIAVACHLLSTTTMKSGAVISALADVPGTGGAQPLAARENLYSRMNAERPPNPGPAGGQRPAAGGDFAAQMSAAVSLVRPPKK